MGILKFLWNHFLNRVVRNNEGILPAAAFLVNPAFWSGAAGATGVAGSLMSMFGGGDKGGGSTGPIAMKLDDYADFGTERGLQSSYARDMMQRNQQGLVSRGFDKYTDAMMKNRMRQLQETFYGRPGERTGVFNTVSELGAQGGVGPKSLMAQGFKAARDYSGQAANIESYINQLQMQQFQKEQQLGPQMLQGLPQGPRYATFAGQVGPQKPDYMGQAMDKFGQAAPWLGDQGGGGGEGTINTADYQLDPYNPIGTQSMDYFGGASNSGAWGNYGDLYNR